MHGFAAPTPPPLILSEFGLWTTIWDYDIQSLTWRASSALNIEIKAFVLEQFSLLYRS